MAHESFECNDDDVKSVFFKLMQEKDLDIREKKSAIIDFISAGIETVSTSTSKLHVPTLLLSITANLFVSAGQHFVVYIILHHQRSTGSDSNPR